MTQIVLIGRQNLQNSLLISFLNQNTKVKCILDETFNAEQLQQADIGSTLVLLDTKDTAINETKRALFKQPLNYNQIHIAYINVARESEYERMISYAGVRGIFYDHDSQQQLLKGILAMFEGEFWLPRNLLTRHLESTRTTNVATLPHSSPLTRREREILRLTATGATNVEIAKQLSVSTHTIKTHMYNIFKKIDVSNRLQAVNWAKLNIGDSPTKTLQGPSNSNPDKAIA